MTEKELLKVAGGIDPRYIMEAAPGNKRPKGRAPKRWPLVLVAAMLSALLLCAALLPALLGKEPVGSETELPDPEILTGGSETELPAPEILTGETWSGMPTKTEGSANAGSNDGASAELAPPSFPVADACGILSARALETLSDVYRSLRGQSYRLVRMEIIDPFESGLSGEFFYALPIEYDCDLTVYSQLLMALRTSTGNVFINETTGELTSVSSVYMCLNHDPSYWVIIPFRDGVFDPTLWESPSWHSAFQLVKHRLEHPEDYEDGFNDNLIVHYGSLYEEAVEKVKRLRAEYEEKGTNMDTFLTYDFTSPEALEALDYIKPFRNGVFDSYISGYQDSYYVSATRYINGCPTNEKITVKFFEGKETVEYSGAKFTEADMAGLYNVADYIERMDLSALEAPNTDTGIEGLKLGYCRAMGWYEKTAAGVECMIKVNWLYVIENRFGSVEMIFEDDLYIHLTAEGAQVLTREEATALLGESDYIERFSQGEGAYVPQY